MAFEKTLKEHTGEKSNKRSKCDLASFQAINFTIHLKTHSGQKPKSMRLLQLCILSGRQFEETFENAQWRKCYFGPKQPEGAPDV